MIYYDTGGSKNIHSSPVRFELNQDECLTWKDIESIYQYVNEYIDISESTIYITKQCGKVNLLQGYIIRVLFEYQRTWRSFMFEKHRNKRKHSRMFK